MNYRNLLSTCAVAVLASAPIAFAAETAVEDSVIAAQRAALAAATEGKGFGPQSPRDIDTLAGSNPNMF